MIKTGLLITLCVTALLATALASQNRPDILIADFEGDTYGKWVVTGEAFSSGPAKGALAGQMPVSAFQGNGLANSFFRGDGTTGTLTSPEFKIERKCINFLVGGGAHRDLTCVNLIVNGKVERSTTGRESEALSWATWRVEEFKGDMAHIEIVDRATGGWGHICADQIVQSDEPKAIIVDTTTLYGETYRPQFHFTSQRGWLNDPNGLVQYDGEYHLFFQHNPKGVQWGNMTWGHAVSRDMLRWEQLPNALDPDERGTMFSGSAVVDWDNTAGFQTGKEKTLIALYTAAGGTNPESKGQPFTQCLAYSNDKGRTWTKYAGNPVLPHVAGENRDPKVVWHAETKRWIMALYLDKEDFALYSSPDLKRWEQIQRLTMPGCSECPDFFVIRPFDLEVWVFTAANGKYLTGQFNGKQFTPSGGVQQVEYGAHSYAVQTYSDLPKSDTRHIQVAWMNGPTFPEMPFNQQMSIPCELGLYVTLNKEVKLYKRPVKEIERLHGREKTAKDVAIQADKPYSWKAELAHILIEFDVQNATAVGLRVRGGEIRYNVASKTLTALGRTAPVALAEDGKTLRLEILVDRASLEVFAQNGVAALTSSYFPHPNETTVEVFSEGAAKIKSLKAYDMKPAWPAK